MGRVTPEKVAKNELDYNDNDKHQTVIDKCNGKFLACVFMHGRIESYTRTALVN